MADMREVRGKAIADQGNQIKQVNDHSFKVKSQSRSGFYEVKATPNGMTCDCPDFVYRGGKCKHIAATRYYLEIEKDTPHGIVTEKVHLTYTQAWNAYNEAQKAEISLFDELLNDLVRGVPEPEQTIGRPRLSIHETLFCSIQKVYSQLSSRRAHGLFQNATEKGQIEHAPNFNQPSILFRNPDITPKKAEEIGVSIEELQIMPDHVNLFVKASPVASPHWIVQQLKSYSSHELRTQFKSLRTRLPTLWTRSYYVESCGHISEDAIRRYIEEQKKV